MADKADSTFDFYFANPTNTLLPEQANFGIDEGLKRTCKVGSYQPNKLGLYDIHGNVWEWCDDAEKAAAGESLRVVRGGGWDNGPICCSAGAYRSTYLPSSRVTSVGLRLARVASGAPSPEVKTSPPSPSPPFSDADAQRIAALPAAEQVEQVRKELVNSPQPRASTARWSTRSRTGVVTEFRIVTDHVTDISPIRVFNALRLLGCTGRRTDEPTGLLADLTPLRGMNLLAVRLENLDPARRESDRRRSGNLQGLQEPGAAGPVRHADGRCGLRSISRACG